MASIEQVQLKELEKLNRNIKDLNKTVLNVGKLMNDAILTLRKTCQLLEEEAHNKTEVVQNTDNIDIMCDNKVIGTLGVDFGTEGKDMQVTQFRDIMTDSDVIIYSNGGKVHQVIRQELDGTREDITEQWLKDHPQEN